MTRLIRQKKVRKGLVLGNGGYVTYHHVAILADKPTGLVYPTEEYLPKLLEVPKPPTVVEYVDSSKPQSCFLESYTLEYDRHNKPSRLFAVVRFNSPLRERALANEKDKSVIEKILKMHAENVEVVGKQGWIQGRGKRNVFWFGEEGKAKI